MIGMLTGTCLMAGTGEAIIDVNGVGYLLQCGSRTLGSLGIGKTVCLHVETHVREQAITLYGFHSEEERAWFVRLQTVQGVGPKAALAILDILTPGQILSAASLEDKSAFARAKGIGPKSASRIATELSGKPAPAGRGFQPVFTKPSGGTPSERLTVMKAYRICACVMMRFRPLKIWVSASPMPCGLSPLPITPFQMIHRWTI